MYTHISRYVHNKNVTQVHSASLLIVKMKSWKSQINGQNWKNYTKCGDFRFKNYKHSHGPHIKILASIFFCFVYLTWYISISQGSKNKEGFAVIQERGRVEYS